VNQVVHMIKDFGCFDILIAMSLCYSSIGLCNG